jgi:plastocyanin
VNRGFLHVASALAGAFALAGAVAADAPARASVIIDGTRYDQPMLTVKRGTIVAFVNKDPFPHTVTAPGKFDSKEIAAGKTWTYKATKAGTFDYICTLHPNMKGTLVVQ